MRRLHAIPFSRGTVATSGCLPLDNGISSRLEKPPLQKHTAIHRTAGLAREASPLKIHRVTARVAHALCAVLAGVVFLLGDPAQASALRDQIQNELDTNPALQAQQIQMRVTAENRGVVTLELSEGPKKLRDLFRKGYEINGDGLAETNFTGETVKALRVIKKVLKKVGGIKGVQEISLTGAIHAEMDEAENLFEEAYPKMIQPDTLVREAALPGLSRSAEMGYAPAQAELARMYSQGMDFRQDDQKAIFWLRKAANQGHAPSQLNLANAFAQGRVIERDYKQAIELARKAASQDRNMDAQTRAQIALALLLATCPDERLRDPNAALEYAKKGCAGAPNGIAIETLAAAYARCGLFAEAIEQEQKWMQQVQGAPFISAAEKQRLLLIAEQRLALYRKNEPFTAAE